jgi:hypothetical protein
MILHTPMRKTLKIATGAAFTALLAGCSTAVTPAAHVATPAPAAHVATPAAHTGTLPAPTVTVTHIVTHTVKPKPSATSLPASSSPSSVPVQQPAAPAQPPMTNPTSVVLQYYQDITDHDYSGAWALGGDNLSGGMSYSTWVAGYQDTTASISVISYGTWSSDEVWADIIAMQLDGSVRTYSGTYTVQGGVMVAANITRSS